jgi:tRNA(fMet)-specific endonuclease VapC
VDACVRPFLSLPFDDAAAEVGARARHHVEAQGAPSGLYDLQIAAIALANNLTRVTHHTSAFRPVPGLVLDDGEVP